MQSNSPRLRDGGSLAEAAAALEQLKARLRPDDTMCWKDRIACFKAENLLTVGGIMVSAALERRESRGVHTRLAYPKQDDQNWRRSIRVSR